MKILFAAAATLMATGSAYAYQSYTTPTDPAVTVAVDPTVAFTPPATWTVEQRTLWDQHMAFLPDNWTAEQRAAFEAMMAVPPSNWTPEQRSLYAQHYAALPTSWSPEQRAAYEQQVASFETPWLGTQTAYTTTTTETTTLAAASPAMVQPSNANPEHDARGIPVISDVAYVPPGYNGIPGGAMGGPSEATDESYPPCTRERTDNCIQLYERGVTGQLDSSQSTTGVGGPYEPVDSSAAKPTSTTSTTTTSTTTSTAKPMSTDTTTTTTDTMAADQTGTTKDDTTPPQY